MKNELLPEGRVYSMVAAQRYRKTGLPGLIHMHYVDRLVQQRGTETCSSVVPVP